MTGRKGTALAAVAALLVGAVAAAGLLVRFTWFDDPCPDIEDEGPMAAPGSLYAQLMCQAALRLEPMPMEAVDLPWALLLAVGASVVGALALVGLRPRVASRRVVTAGIVGVLVAPSMVVLALQVSLPRDCFSGRSDTGECSRDRENR